MVKIQNRTKFLPLQTPEITFLMVKSELSRSKMSTNERFYKLEVSFLTLPFQCFIVNDYHSCAFNICA